MGMFMPLSPSRERGRVLCLNQLTLASLPVNFFVLWRRRGDTNLDTPPPPPAAKRWRPPPHHRRLALFSVRVGPGSEVAPLSALLPWGANASVKGGEGSDSHLGYAGWRWGMVVCHLFCLLEGGVEKERKKVKEPLSPLGFRGKRTSLCGSRISAPLMLLGKGDARAPGYRKVDRRRSQG